MNGKIKVVGDTIEFMGQPVATIKGDVYPTLRADFVAHVEHLGDQDKYQRGCDTGYLDGFEDGDD